MFFLFRKIAAAITQREGEMGLHELSSQAASLTTTFAVAFLIGRFSGIWLIFIANISDFKIASQALPFLVAFLQPSLFSQPTLGNTWSYQDEEILNNF